MKYQQRGKMTDSGWETDDGLDLEGMEKDYLVKKKKQTWTQNDVDDALSLRDLMQKTHQINKNEQDEDDYTEYKGSWGNFNTFSCNRANRPQNPKPGIN